MSVAKITTSGFYNLVLTSGGIVKNVDTLPPPLQYETVLFTNVSDVAVGEQHIVFISNQRVYAIGDNTCGQLGNGTFEDSDNPSMFNLYSPKAVFAGSNNSFIVMTDGTCYATGYNASGQLGIGENCPCVETPTKIKIDEKVVSVSSGEEHTLFLTESGNVYACGRNLEGQLGVPNTDENVITPIKILSKVKQVSAGSFHSVFLMDDGTVKGCGYNEYGQVGGLPQLDVTVPTSFSNINNCAQIATGKSHTVFLFDTGHAQAIGFDDLYNQGLGINSKVPVDIDVPRKIKQITARNSVTGFLFEDDSYIFV